jgi:hypothetical protein
MGILVPCVIFIFCRDLIFHGLSRIDPGSEDGLWEKIVRKKSPSLFWSKKSLPPYFTKKSSPNFFSRIKSLLFQKVFSPVFFQKSLRPPFFRKKYSPPLDDPGLGTARIFNCIYHTPIKTPELLDPTYITH